MYQIIPLDKNFYPFFIEQFVADLLNGTKNFKIDIHLFPAFKGEGSDKDICFISLALPDLSGPFAFSHDLKNGTFAKMIGENGLLEQDEQDLFEHLRIVVDKGQSLLRIDKFLMHRVENASRNRIQNAVELGNVLVNDKSIKSSYRVKPMDVISVVLPHPPRDTEVYPENIPLNIVYEDDDVLLVNKPAGLVVHPGYNNYTGTLVNGLVYHFQQLPTLPGNDGRPGLVHRIDKDTSGLLLISKNERAMTLLARQFYEHTITRKYIALVWGDLEQDGTVDGYIGRSIGDRRVMAIYDDPDKGKWSVTHYKVLERLGYVTLIECKLETGRTHQIRAHLKHIGRPLFSDAAYGGDKILKGTVFSKYKQFVENCFELMPRQALHAQSLGFFHPTLKKNMHFEASLPPDFKSVLDKWKSYSRGDLKLEANDPDQQIF